MARFHQMILAETSGLEQPTPVLYTIQDLNIDVKSKSVTKKFQSWTRDLNQGAEKNQITRKKF